MSGDVQLELWMNEYKLDALAAVLARENTTVEQRMQDALTELYVSLVPPEVRQEISTRIKEELAAQETEMETSRKYAVFHVWENSREEYFQVNENQELLYTARDLRRYLRQGSETDAGSFSELYPRRELITPEEFDRMVGVRMENTGKVTGAYEIDFDKREFSSVHIMDGWKTWAIGDVSTAAYHAFRRIGLSIDARYELLLERLDGREITSAGHLSVREISFADEISEINGLLNFYMETGFNVDAVFGTHVCTSENDDTLNVYANYDCSAGQVCDELEVDLHRADGREESLPYTLNAAEKEVLLRKMDAYCQEQTGQTLRDYSAQLMVDDMAPPTQPLM
ncbi:hypothetical protein [Oscillibacter sp.]|jgi:hypothetical protein|uniref:hypothetical protein n=1 Tax=Oscillibacter sp. TaxID=1945593 RepID=UPI0026347BCE|nr:hypothetical protein [Oscillibacter sp.]